MNNEALLVAESLAYGSIHRGKCPECHGGDKGERSWVVGREPDRVWWKCFRAACGSAGVVGGHSLAPAAQAERDRALERIRPYTGNFKPLEEADRDYFWERFELTCDPIDICLSDHDEYILTVRGPRREVKGYVQRQPVWRGVPKAPREGRKVDVISRDPSGVIYHHAMPKTKLYCHSTAPMLAWYQPLPPYNENHARYYGWEPGPNLVIVEDQLSAMKVAQCGVPAVALLGNGINVEGVRDICREQPSIVTIALDPGAEGAAQSLARKWGLYWNRTRVVALEADPKDIPRAELLNELGV